MFIFWGVLDLGMIVESLITITIGWVGEVRKGLK